MLKNHFNAHKTCLFGQITKQPLSYFETWKSWKYKQIWGLQPDHGYLLLPTVTYGYLLNAVNIVNMIIKNFNQYEH